VGPDQRRDVTDPAQRGLECLTVTDLDVVFLLKSDNDFKNVQ
jgi:hypothetical protein